MKKENRVTVRAKFKVCEINKYSDGISVTLRPVVTGSKENEQFFAATPWGELKMGTVNQAAASQFAVGDEFYIDLTKAD